MPPDSITDISVYRSKLHPEGRTRRSLFGTEMVTPLGVAMLPLMIGTLVSMLQGFSVLSVLYIGFPIALGVSFFWTWLRLRSQIGEILISDEKVAFRSVFGASSPSDGPEWKLLIDLRPMASGLTVTVGLEEFVLTSSDWPNWSILLNHLQTAYRLGAAAEAP
ncbi:MAG: hypothetical protein O3B41_02945 [Bacteroidetes bacterium]|nr:hypothetical protein [Bacteroidota bacterium]